jgi:hypothetical protein
MKTLTEEISFIILTHPVDFKVTVKHGLLPNWKLQFRFSTEYLTYSILIMILFRLWITIQFTSILWTIELE